jgi:hypothetical protein
LPGRAIDAPRIVAKYTTGNSLGAKTVKTLVGALNDDSIAAGRTKRICVKGHCKPL